jgi:hypothetical protein
MFFHPGGAPAIGNARGKSGFRESHDGAKAASFLRSRFAASDKLHYTVIAYRLQ